MIGIALKVRRCSPGFGDRIKNPWPDLYSTYDWAILTLEGCQLTQPRQLCEGRTREALKKSSLKLTLAQSTV